MTSSLQMKQKNFFYQSRYFIFLCLYLGLPYSRIDILLPSNGVILKEKFSFFPLRAPFVTYGVSLIDVAAGGEEEVGDALGAAEGGPVQRDVHLHVRDEGVRALLQQVPDHNLMPAGRHRA